MVIPLLQRTPFVSGSKFVDTCRIQLKGVYSLNEAAPQTSLHVPQTSLFFAPSQVLVLAPPGPLFPQSQSISTFPELSPPPDPSFVGRVDGRRARTIKVGQAIEENRRDKETMDLMLKEDPAEELEVMDCPTLVGMIAVNADLAEFKREIALSTTTPGRSQRRG